MANNVLRGAPTKANELLELEAPDWIITGREEDGRYGKTTFSTLADAAAAAEDALAQLTDLSVTAETGAAGSSASASYDPETGVLSLVIPRGDTGGATISVSIEGTLVQPAASALNFIGLNISDTGGGAITIRLDSIGTGPVVRSRRPIIDQPTDIILPATAEGCSLHFTGATGTSVTVPADATHAIPVGAEFELVRIGAGDVSITAEPSVTLNGVAGGTAVIAMQWGGVVARKIAADAWLLIGTLGEIDPPVAAASYVWDDVFADHTAAGGEDWTGWGTTVGQPAEAALEFFLTTVLPADAPTGATVTLDSPTGTMHLRGRVQPPGSSLLQNWTLDFGDTIIERGKTGTFWGQIHLWGEAVENEAAGIAAVGTAAAVGATALTLKDEPDTTAFLAEIGAGAIAFVRTNATAPDYHPSESREIIYISSVSGRTLNLARPLSISVPVNNPLDYPGETSDPSTVTLLAGSLLTADAAAGATQVQVADASAFAAGDWAYLSTSELPTPTGNQFAGTLGALLDPGEEFGDILMNEELHRVIAVSGNQLTLSQPLGKNKLLAWNAACVKVDPISGATVKGGSWVGQEDGSAAEAWEHQYIWGRFCVGSTISDTEFDMDAGRPLAQRRMGQAVRLDTGTGNLITRNTIGQGGSIEAGEGYGISMRRGERGTVASHNDVTKCRHGVEFWSTSGGCRAEINTITNGTSSDLDTHGSWNVDVTIQQNSLSNDGLLLSPDLGGLPDAIRVGNNKFWLDDGVQVLNNTVTNYRGNAFNLVPGARNVTVDGLDCDNVDRILGIAGNSRHPALYSENVVIRNVTGDDIRDRIAEVAASGSGRHVRGLTLENWTIGGTGLGTAALAGILNMRLADIEDLVLDNVRLEAINTQTFHYAWTLENIVGVTFTDCYQDGGQRGITATDVTGISGNITIEHLAATTKHVFRGQGTTTGSLTVTHDPGYVPAVVPNGVTVTLVSE